MIRALLKLALASAEATLFCLHLAAAETSAGLASWYDYPQPLACGGRYKAETDSAAHKTLPCGTRVRVTAKSGKSVIVTINDRGPYIRGRVIDLARKPARELGMLNAGVIPVTLEVLK